MKAHDLIEKTINQCIEHKQYFGLGNPNAKILFVGKEAGMDKNDVAFHGSPASWKTNDYSKRFIAKGHVKHGRHTWQKYQKLYDLILERLGKLEEIPPRQADEITFVEHVFTTELSNLHAKTTNEAKTHPDFAKALKERKENFWQSEFIDSFPIILIAANDNKYIETVPGEVCQIFHVDFVKLDETENAEKLWIHYANDKSKVHPRLLIHTRQLTNGASTKLLEKIADIVHDFVKGNAIQLFG
jgi:hypothetical protein